MIFNFEGYDQLLPLVTNSLIVGALLAVATPSFVRAETISGALAKAYVTSPELNAQRAAVRAADGEWEARKVRLGLSDAGWSQVREGIEPGAVVSLVRPSLVR